MGTSSHESLIFGPRAWLRRAVCPLAQQAGELGPPMSIPRVAGLDSRAVDMHANWEYQNTMNVDRIRKLFTGGFRPFVLRTADGHEFDVPHPEFIAISNYDVVVVSKQGDIDILDPAHIVSLKLLKRRDGTAMDRG